MIIHQRYLDDTIKALHEEGIMEISEISREEAEKQLQLESSPIHPETMICINYEQRLKELQTILKKQQQKKTGLKSLLHPSITKPQNIDDISTDELYSDIESLLSQPALYLNRFYLNLPATQRGFLHTTYHHAYQPCWVD